MIYSLFIERPRTGAAPVPYGPFLKTKSLAEAESWVASPVLTAKAAANVREGDLFVARYPDPKLRDERGPISRVAAFGRVLPRGGLAICSTTQAFGSDDLSNNLASWLTAPRAHNLLVWAKGVPRPLLVAAACAVAKSLKKSSPQAKAAITAAEQWARGKVGAAHVEAARLAATASMNGVPDEVRYAIRAAAHAATTVADADAAARTAGTADLLGDGIGTAAVRAIWKRADIVRGVIKFPDWAISLGHPSS